MIQDPVVSAAEVYRFLVEADRCLIVDMRGPARRAQFDAQNPRVSWQSPAGLIEELSDVESLQKAREIGVGAPMTTAVRETDSTQSPVADVESVKLPERLELAVCSTAGLTESDDGLRHLVNQLVKACDTLVIVEPAQPGAADVDIPMFAALLRDLNWQRVFNRDIASPNPAIAGKPRTAIFAASNAPAARVARSYETEIQRLEREVALAVAVARDVERSDAAQAQHAMHQSLIDRDRMITLTAHLERIQNLLDHTRAQHAETDRQLIETNSELRRVKSSRTAKATRAIRHPVRVVKRAAGRSKGANKNRKSIGSRNG